MREYIFLKPNTYQYASMRLKSSIDFALLFLQQRDSTSFWDKHLRNEKVIGLTALEVNPKKFQYLSINLRADAEILKVASKNNQKIKRYAAERYRNTFRSYQNV